MPPENLIHLGVWAGGWEFIVRGYSDNPRKRPPFVPIGVHSLRDLCVLIVIMTENGWKIEDEYGKTTGPLEFIEGVYDTRLWRGSPSKSHMAFLEETAQVTDEDYRDPEGWTICEKVFS